MDADTVIPPRAGRREWIGLGVLMLPLLLVSMDVSVLYFAVPFISRDLRPSSTEQLWMLDVYGFVLAGLLITMGWLGDRIGRRRLLIIGAAAFGGASVVAAYSSGAETLIAARALLGIGGATLMPSTLALIRNMFHDEKQRSTAVGIWTAGTTAGISLGPVLGGFLLNHFWWGSAFLINTPFMVMLLVLGPLLLPESRNPAAGRFDLLGSALSLGAVLPTVWGLKQLAADGPGLLPAVAVAAGLAVGAAFLHRQRTRPEPMIDLSLFRNRGFSGAITVNTVAMFALIGFTLFSMQYLQSVLGLDPLEGALWCLIPSAAVGVAAPTATVLVRRASRSGLICAAFLLAAAGYMTMAVLRPDTPLWVALTGAGVAAVGVVTAVTLVSDLFLGTVPPERAGSASALLETGQEFGGALGMAVLGSIGAAVYRRDVVDRMPAGLPPGTLHTVRETLGGAAATADRLPARTGAAVLHGAREAFCSGLHAAALGAAVLLVVAGVFAAVLLRRAPTAPTPPMPSGAGLPAVSPESAPASS
ncbi:MFS transporter [Peterkaempfera bronchialis]|uniref:MFS transporter n=1 Tax=Peterkaempfera bronchialis TaxID=2126346 RepID=UPI003C2ED7B6